MNLGTSLGVSMITGLFDTDPSSATSAKKRAPFELRVGPFLNYELEVLSFRGKERVNDVYRYEVTLATSVDENSLHTSLFGQPACLTLKAPGYDPRVIQGLVASVEALGGVPGEQGTGKLRYRVELVPRLWLMKRRRKNRVFQQRSAPDIVNAMLAEIGMDPCEIRWRAVLADYPKLPFVYQRNESDFDFLRRVLADAGIFFYFEHASSLLAGLMSAIPGAADASASASVGGLGVSIDVSVGVGATATVSAGGSTVLNFAALAGNTPSIAPAAAAALSAGLSTSASLPGVSIDVSAPGVSASVGFGGLSASVSVGAGSSGSSNALSFDDGMGAVANDDLIYEFGLKKVLRTKTLRLHERDVETATSWVAEQSVAPAPPTVGGPAAVSVSVSVGLGGVSASVSAEDPSGRAVPFNLDATLVDPTVLREERYQVDGFLPLGRDPTSISNPRMAVELARARRRFLEAEGESDCRRLAAGYRFTLADHPIKALNGEYIVVSLDARGSHPDYAKDTEHVYRNRFRCIPSSSAPMPARPKKRPKLGIEMAQVVAYTDIAKVPWLESSPNGYVKIRFHWDIVDKGGVSTGMLDDGATHASGTQDQFAVWVPVMQPWAGAGYGAQFIPREGMDVLVGFLEDQGERPVILGCLYSGANPLPWGAQNDQQKIGIRSQTRAANGGYSELSIDDRQGGEVVRVQAQMDLTTTVLQDSTVDIGNDETTTIAHDRSLAVGNNDTQTVTGDAARTVAGADSLTVTGNSTTAITGDASIAVTGKTTETLTGDVTRTFGGDVVAKTAGATDQSFADDYTERHLGHRTVVVGSGDAGRAAVLHIEGTGRVYASKTIEIEVLQSVTLICGQSQLLVSPTGITLNSPNISFVGKEVDVVAGAMKTTLTGDLTMAAGTATVQTAGAKVALDASSATITGSQVKIASGAGSLSTTASAPVKVTTVQMKDGSGKPRANARVLLTQGGPKGTQRMTVLDADGELELIGDASYSISFPDDPVKK